jgi:lipopolysaccharide/colanic/teichoic acid biosynthesis glycosyltransferase
VLKRMFDVGVSAGAIFVLSPLMLSVAALIKKEDGGSVLYSGTRVGLSGQPFKMHKFRTMVPNADKIGGPSTAGDDPRLTRIGIHLRKYKMDELPQLFNVLKGEMSLVGPRPEVPFYVDMYTPEEREILTVRPGITDWASIRYRNEGEILRGAADPEQAYMERIRPGKIRLGREYARHHTLVGDLQILAATVKAVLVPDSDLAISPEAATAEALSERSGAPA